jgi:hypothetical protein
VKPATEIRLALPAARTERDRFALVVASTAVAGGLVLAAAKIAAQPGGGTAAGAGLAPYVTQDGLRPGVVVAALVLTLPVLALAGQALRVGSPARERRLAALRLAGATPADTSLIAAAETGLAALVGGVLAGPAYLVLWVATGVLPIAGLKLLLPPDLRELLFWVVLVLLAAGVGAAVGYRTARQGPVQTAGTQGGPRRVGWGRTNRAMLFTGSGLTVATVLAMVSQPGGRWWVVPVPVVSLLLLAFAVGPRLVRWSGRRLQRRGGAENLLAGRRLELDPRPAGRVAAVLLVCGATLGLDVLVAVPALVAWLAGAPPEASVVFFVNGFGLAAIAAAFSTAIAVLTLVVGAADQLLNAQRPLASLAALGVEETSLLRMLRRQLSAAAVPAVALGAFIGVVGLSVLSFVPAAAGGVDGAYLRVLALLLVAATAIASVLGLAASLVARAAGRLLRPRVRTALAPENLRAP